MPLDLHEDIHQTKKRGMQRAMMGLVAAPSLYAYHKCSPPTVRTSYDSYTVAKHTRGCEINCGRLHHLQGRYLGQGCQAVGGTGGIGDDVVLLGVVLLLVHTHHKHLGIC